MALVERTYPEDFAQASQVVVADACPPPVVCDRAFPFDAYVVLVPPHGDFLRAVQVVGEVGPERILGEAPIPLPAHVIALIDGAAVLRTHPPGLPVDPSLTVVSRSAPGEDAARALFLCVGDDLQVVDGMAQLPANRVHLFMLTNGKEPELASNDLIWAVQLKGRFPTRVGPVTVDDLCVVKDGIPLEFAPYGDVSGKWTPPPHFVWPIYALPPLAP